MRAISFFLTVCFSLLAGCDNTPQPSASLEVAAKGLHAGALSQTGEYSVIGSIYHGGSLWRWSTQERIFNWNHADDEPTTIIAADFSNDDQYAVTADPFTLVLWDTQTGEGSRYWAAPGDILDIELGPQSRLALLGLSDHSAVLFDIQRGGIKRTLKHQNRVRSVALSENGRWALTGSEDYHARFWDLSSGEIVHSIKHNDDVQLVALSQDGKTALSVSKYDKALIWNTETGEAIGELPLKGQKLARGLQFTCAVFSADGAHILTGRPDQMVQLWDVQTLTLKQEWKLPKRDPWKPTAASVIAVSFGEQRGQFFALASNGFIHELRAPLPRTTLTE